MRFLAISETPLEGLRRRLPCRSSSISVRVFTAKRPRKDLTAARSLLPISSLTQLAGAARLSVTPSIGMPDNGELLPSVRAASPAWIVAGNETLVARSSGCLMRTTWFAFPARFLGCTS